jgi:hypothetical protein
LKLREREAFDLWNAGKISQQQLTVEIERSAIAVSLAFDQRRL